MDDASPTTRLIGGLAGQDAADYVGAISAMLSRRRASLNADQSRLTKTAIRVGDEFDTRPSSAHSRRAEPLLMRHFDSRIPFRQAPRGY